MERCADKQTITGLQVEGLLTHKSVELLVGRSDRKLNTKMGE